MAQEPGPNVKKRRRLRDRDWFWLFTMFAVLGLIVLALDVVVHVGWHVSFDVPMDGNGAPGFMGGGKHTHYGFGLKNASEEGFAILIIDRDALVDSHNEYLVRENTTFDYREFRITITELTPEKAVVDVRYKDIW